MILKMVSVAVYALVVSFVALLYSLLTSLRILRLPSGTKEMVEISNAIRDGANAFMLRQYKTVWGFGVVIVAILWYLFGFSFAVSFFVGALFSTLAGIIGMSISVRANVKVTNKAKEGLGSALSVGFLGGSVTGMAVVGLALMVVSILYLLFNDVKSLIGLGFGASLISLFARVGGGIYTKAADVGADLVGKVEAGIPEDDIRNPAVIADNVGDNVGDCAGMGADLYETYVVTILAAMLLGAIPAISGNVKMAVEYPLILGAIAILASIAGTFFVKLPKNKNIMAGLYYGLIVSGVLALIGFYFATIRSGNSLNLFFAAVVGLVVTLLINVITEYYTSSKYKPVRSIAKASTTGAGTNLISGLGWGLQSTVLPTLVILLGIIVSYQLAGVYGIAIAAVSMLSLTGMIISIDAFGPITDNAGGIAEMSNLDKKVREVTDALDAVGNTTKAVTKGYAIGSAALAALALFTAFIQEVKIDVFNLTDPAVLIGLFVGGLLPFVFSALCMAAVGRAAYSIVNEVRRQFKEIKGIMERRAKPEYGRCVDIVTSAALKNMILPAMIAILSPLLVGLLFGVEALGGLLVGVIITGLLMALFMCTTGAAWDNAKKYISAGNLGGKGSDTYKAAVVGDTVGDPFKDTAGPALNALIKVINTFAILFAGIFLAYGLRLI